ncbi:hypothetical protein EJB05_21986, partial [Eragrostis curvula]
MTKQRLSASSWLCSHCHAHTASGAARHVARVFASAFSSPRLNNLTGSHHPTRVAFFPFLSLCSRDSPLLPRRHLTNCALSSPFPGLLAREKSRTFREEQLDPRRMEFVLIISLPLLILIIIVAVVLCIVCR